VALVTPKLFQTNVPDALLKHLILGNLKNLQNVSYALSETMLFFSPDNNSTNKHKDYLDFVDYEETEATK
jgi:hypothetical protein